MQPSCQFIEILRHLDRDVEMIIGDDDPHDPTSIIENEFSIENAFFLTRTHPPAPQPTRPTADLGSTTGYRCGANPYSQGRVCVFACTCGALRRRDGVGSGALFPPPAPL